MTFGLPTRDGDAVRYAVCADSNVSKPLWLSGGN